MTRKVMFDGEMVVDPDAMCPTHGCAQWRCDDQHPLPMTRIDPFDKLYEHDARDAGQMAQAFISANDSDQLYAILRFLNATQNRDLSPYLDGCYFLKWADDDGLESGAFEELRNLAYAYRDSLRATPGIWKV